MQTLKPKPYFPIKIQTQTCDSLLHVHIHIDRTSVFQPIKQTGKKKDLCNNENLCLFSAIVKTENLCSPLQQQLIKKLSCLCSSTTDNSKGRHSPPPPFWFSIQLPFLGFSKIYGFSRR